MHSIGLYPTTHTLVRWIAARLTNVSCNCFHFQWIIRILNSISDSRLFFSIFPSPSSSSSYYFILSWAHEHILRRKSLSFVMETNEIVIWCAHILVARISRTYAVFRSTDEITYMVVHVGVALILRRDSNSKQCVKIYLAETKKCRSRRHFGCEKFFIEWMNSHHIMCAMVYIVSERMGVADTQQPDTYVHGSREITNFILFLDYV